MDNAPEITARMWGMEAAATTPLPFDKEHWWMETVQALQVRSFHAILPHPPPILFASPPPAPPPPDEFWPTDFLGRYFCGGSNCTGAHLSPPSGRRIELYPSRIRACAASLMLDEAILTRIVLVHEVLHALLHTGYRPLPVEYRNADEKIMDYEAHDWDYSVVSSFLDRRLTQWSQLAGPKNPSPVLELHAQLGTWHMIQDNQDCADAFVRLLQHQPPEYSVSAELRTTKPLALWSWMCLARNPDFITEVGSLDGMVAYLHGDCANELPRTLTWVYSKIF